MSTTARAFAVDSNVLLRYLTRDNEDLWAKADAAMARMANGEIILHCEPMILGEMVWVLSSFFKLTRREISDLLEPLVSAKGFHIPGKGRYIRALELYGSSVPHFGDACACAAAIEESEGRLLSFDKELSAVEGVERTEWA